MWIRVPSTGTCFSRKSPIVERQITIFDGSTVSNYRIFVDKSHVLSLHHGKSVNHQILLRKNILLVKSYVNFRYIQFPFIKSHEKSRCFRLIHHVSMDWFRENLHRKPSIFHSFSHEICFFFPETMGFFNGFYHHRAFQTWWNPPHVASLAASAGAMAILARFCIMAIMFSLGWPTICWVSRKIVYIYIYIFMFLYLYIYIFIYIFLYLDIYIYIYIYIALYIYMYGIY